MPRETPLSRKIIHLLSTSVALLLIIQFLPPLWRVIAASDLTVTLITWNVIGLDSNSPATGPNRFPVGARVCNDQSVAAENVEVTFNWDSANPYINLRTGTASSVTIPSLAANGGCADVYFEVEVSRVEAAYDTVRRYFISAVDSTGHSTSSPRPRELIVERLISQNRNSIKNVELDGTLIPVGGSMSLVVGNTYTIKLYGGTATQGYNQFEAFINLPNTIFQILSVSTNYSANNSPYVSTTGHPYLYADACRWENDPNSPKYLSCIGGDYKSGGSNVVTTFVVKIVGGGGTTQSFNTLLYDFSGSSFHYNSDYSVGARLANIVDPTNVDIAKAFTPATTTVNGVSSLTFTLSNPNSSEITDLRFIDSFPGDMRVASPLAYSTSGCGPAVFAPTVDATSLSFSNGSIAANSICTIKVNVTTSTTGTFSNTTDHLFVGETDTNKTATADLVVTEESSSGTGICNLTLAEWTFVGFTTNPPPFPAPLPKAANVTTAAISVGGTSPGSLTAVSDTNIGSPSVPSMGLYGWPKNGPINTATFPYIQFAIDTSHYSSIEMGFQSIRKSPGPNNLELHSSTDGSTWTKVTDFNPTTSWAAYGPYPVSGTSTTGITYFRIYGYGANATTSGNDMNLDNVRFSGCGTPVKPTISKAFSPTSVAVNGTATLTFTLTNPNSMQMTGVKFSDTLPDGLEVASPTNHSTTCGGTPSWEPVAGSSILNFGQTNGATIPANSSCTVSVVIKVTTAGPHDNISGFLSTTESGTNGSSLAIASLNGLRPPSISKIFSPNPVVAQGITTLTFIVDNPNLNDALTGVVFTDDLPDGLTVAPVPSAITTDCGAPTFAPTAGSASISFTGGTIQPGRYCTASVNVTAAAPGDYVNSTSNVLSTNGGAGGSDTTTLTVTPPRPGISIRKEVGTSASGPWMNFAAVGVEEDVFYRFVVENIGDVPLSSISVTDPILEGTPADPAACSWVDPLPVASATQEPTAICMVGPISSQAGLNLNTATAQGFYDLTGLNDTASARYATTGLSLTKSALETYFSAALDTIHYSYLVKNTGSAPLAGPVTVVDDKVSVVCPEVDSVGDLDNFFDPAEEMTCTAIYTVTAEDVLASSVTNTASAAVDGFNSNISSKTVYQQAPDLVMSKTNDVDGSLASGDSFNWQLEVTNAGYAAAVFSESQVIVEDTLPGVAASYPQGSLSVTNGSISPQGTINCSVTGVLLTCTAGSEVTLPMGASFITTVGVHPSASGSLTNFAEVDPDDHVDEIDEDNNSASNTVFILSPPAISKVFSPEAVLVGGESTLTFTIINSNPSTPLSGVAFSDPLPVGLKVAGDPEKSVVGCGFEAVFNPVADDVTLSFSGGMIAAGGTCTVGVKVVATSPGAKSNVSAAVSSTNGGTGNTASDILTVNTAEMMVEKSADPLVYGDAGETITYTYLVANTGDVPLSSISLLDDKAGVVDCPAASLAVGAEMTCTKTYLTTEADAAEGSVTNVVTASSAEAPDATDTATIQQANLTVTKTADPVVFTDAGDVITYTYVVQNSGDLQLTNLNLVDDILGTIVCPQSTLAGGASMTCSATYVVTEADYLAGSVINTVSVSSDEDLTATDTATVHLALISVQKTADPVYYDAAGDEITYTYVVRNTGQAPITDIQLTDDILGPISCPRTTLAVSASMVCTQTYTITEADVSAGMVTNLVTAVSTEALPAKDSVTVNLASLLISKTASDVEIVNPDLMNLTYTIVITNESTVDLTNLQVEDDLEGAFSSAAGFNLVSLNVSGLTKNPGFNGVSDIALLSGSDTLSAGQSASISLVVQINTGGRPLSFTNTATASGFTPEETEVTATSSFTGPEFADPAVTKSADMERASLGDLVTFTIDVTNRGTVAAENVIVIDPLPSNLDVVSAIATEGRIAEVILPRTVRVEIGTLQLDEEVQITIIARVNGNGGASTSNTVTLTTDSLTDEIVNNQSTVSIGLVRSVLPNTGFVPNMITHLPSQSLDKMYQKRGDLWLEIPSQELKMRIVGVPKVNGEWDVTWLWTDAGYLEGSAFPTHTGNTVLTGHVTFPTGLPGPFSNISKLKWGDRILIRAFGSTYTYEVKDVLSVKPTDTTSVFQHEENDWISLVTCKQFDLKAQTYQQRLLVRAVLVSVEESR